MSTMFSRAYSLPLARRLVGRYLMFGLAGLFVCISLLLVFYYFGTFQEHIIFAAAAAMGFLLVGAFVLHRTVWVNQAIEEQLRRFSTTWSSDSNVLQPLADSDSAAVGWNSVIQHLRQQRIAASLEARFDELTASTDEKKWNRIFHALHEGIAVCDRNSVIVMANNAFASLLGLADSQQAVGRRILELVADTVQVGMVGLSNDSVSGLAPFVAELRKGSSLADGVWRISRTPLLDDEMQDSATLWTVRDITQQKMAEEMRNQFVFTATHELRTPLANIRAYAETLADSDNIDISDQKNFFNIINNEATRLSRFVDELLNVSQMEAGSVTLTCGETDVERLLKEVVENLKPQIQQKELQFETHFAAKLPKLRVDKDKVVAALVNLLGNAVKYTASQGTVRFLVEVDEGQICFHVEDTGIGISSEELPRISEKFFRSSDSRVQNIVGSGLGLAFSQEVARLHRGKITVKSELNKGSRFSLNLPLS
jgi:PAS domain S-box-containing protein